MNTAEQAARERYDAAVAAHRRGALDEAERHYRAVHETYPRHPGVLHGIGLICRQTGRLEDAAALLARAAAIAPKDAAIQTDLGTAYLLLGRYEEAARGFDAALAARPGDAAALMGLGDALSILGRTDEARRAFERLLAKDANHAAAHFGLGGVLTQLGDFAAARAAFERAVALAPERARFHRALAETARFTPDDPRLAALEALAQRSLRADEEVELHFALAKAYDDLARHEAAFEHLRQGNARKRGMVDYDEAAVVQSFRAIASAFAPDAPRREEGYGSDLPIFIVGMPRSGSTLVEQILASHGAVFGAGELLYVSDLVAALPDGPLTDDALQRFGRDYVRRLRALAPDAKRIVDKLPANFRHLGLIHLALPQARIIHVHRDPMDTCFSCYSKLFLNGLNYSYDLRELGRYYRMYEALMAHWRGKVPMLEVSYETLVGDLEGEARRIVAYCGLDWDARCLAFHETRRAVRTLSQAQVRRPVFTSAIGRWRPYARWLEPLRDALSGPAPL